MIDTSLDSSNFYFFLAVFQGLLFAPILIFRKPKRRTTLFFGVLILLFSLSLLHLILEESISGFNAIFPIPMEFSLAYGPLAYFHILYIKDPKRVFRRKDLIHFLPTLLIDGIFFTAMFLYIGANMKWAYAHLLTIQSIGLIIVLILAVQLSIYTYFIYRELTEAKHVLREFQKIKKWLNTLIGLWSVLIGFLVIAVPVALIFIEAVDDNSSLIYKPLGSILGLCIYILGYLYSLKYSKVVESYSDRVAKLSFSIEEMDDKKEQILNALSKDRVYLDPNLTIAKFASHLNWPINSVSSIINESLQTNFNDLIGKHRVEDFKDRLLASDSYKYSILGLGQEAGFSSKASFYRAFKKETGMTPSDYIKSQA